MSILNKDLKKRIIEISYKHKLSHLGSCLTAVDIIDEIFKKGDLHNRDFVLSSGHAGLAYYVVLEKYTFKNAEEIFNHHGVHPDRCSECGISASSGSLGHGIGIAVGMALANPNKTIYCLISDGECAEGSVWEALNVIEGRKMDNIKVYVNHNYYGAYRKIDNFRLKGSLNNIGTGRSLVHRESSIGLQHLPFLQGQDAHYYTMKEEDYNEAMEILNAT